MSRSLHFDECRELLTCAESLRQKEEERGDLLEETKHEDGFKICNIRGNEKEEAFVFKGQNNRSLELVGLCCCHFHGHRQEMEQPAARCLEYGRFWQFQWLERTSIDVEMYALFRPNSPESI